jgi:hypothetical protein
MFGLAHDSVLLAPAEDAFERRAKTQSRPLGGFVFVRSLAPVLLVLLVSNNSWVLM